MHEETDAEGRARRRQIVDALLDLSSTEMVRVLVEAANDPGAANHLPPPGRTPRVELAEAVHDYASRRGLLEELEAVLADPRGATLLDRHAAVVAAWLFSGCVAGLAAVVRLTHGEAVDAAMFALSVVATALIVSLAAGAYDRGLYVRYWNWSPLELLKHALDSPGALFWYAAPSAWAYAFPMDNLPFYVLGLGLTLALTQVVMRETVESLLDRKRDARRPR